MLARKSIIQSISIKGWREMDKDKIWKWLTTGTPKKNECLILAASYSTNLIKARTEKSSNDSRCTLCKEAEKNVDCKFCLHKTIVQTDYKE